MITDIIPIIQKVTERQNLTATETEKAFKILEGEDLESYFLFAFLAALHAKGETSDELLGFCKANEHFVPPFDIGVDADKIIDLSGTGGDRINTPNISTAASFIVASKDIAVAKQAFFAVTGTLGSSDLIQAFGADPLGISREGPDKVRSTFKKTCLVIYHANSIANPDKRKGFFNWVNKRREIGLNHVTAYHLAANAYSPIPMKRRIYGVFDEKYLKPLAELFQKLGYNKGLVFCGIDGLDEVSNVGDTKIIEFSETELKDYTITPADLGVQIAQTSEISGEGYQNCISTFLQIIYGKERGAKRDLALINAAAAFYIMDEVQTIKNGVGLAANLIDDGKVSAKFEEYIKSCGDINKLETLKSKAKV